jgi:hypothetical protein
MTERGSERKVSEGVRPAALLGADLEMRLSAYVNAAVAAGVGFLTLTQAADAKIVYTLANTNIPVNGSPVLLDVNHDGSPDFSLFNSALSNIGAFRSFLRASAPDRSNAIWGRGVFAGVSNTSVFASALRAGSTVGPSKAYFQKGSRWLMWYRRNVYSSEKSYWKSTYNTFGQWFNTRRRYLGLKFMIDGEVHYGWARFTVFQANAYQAAVATLTGYAYETIANKPIITGKTKGPDVITLERATLGHLAQGASGISAWRGKK